MTSTFIYGSLVLQVRQNVSLLYYHIFVGEICAKRAVLKRGPLGLFRGIILRKHLRSVTGLGRDFEIFKMVYQSLLF